jgi:hypothetical protein
VLAEEFVVSNESLDELVVYEEVLVELGLEVERIVLD